MPLTLSPYTLMQKAERDQLVARHRAARATYNRAMDEHTAQLGLPGELGIDSSSSVFVDSDAYRRAKRSLADMKEAHEECLRRLPRLALACCPLCEKALFRSFDPFGLDGLWWRSDASPDEPTPCPHFCILQGAVDLAGSKPEPDFEVHPGPGVPFVVPRLLEQPGTVAVVSDIQMLDGARAYPIAYFAQRRPPVQALAASWVHTNFGYSTQMGVHAWRRVGEGPSGGPEILDYELGPWVAQQKLRWCDAGGDGSTLSQAPPSAFPFLNLSGVRRPQRVSPVRE